MPDKRKFLAYTMPFVVFVLLLGLGSVLQKTGHRFLFSSAAYWIYPAQTILCGLVVISFLARISSSTVQSNRFCGRDRDCRLFALDYTAGLSRVPGPGRRV